LIYINYLYQEIELIRHKPAAYLGRINLTALNDYLDGFQAAIHTVGKYDVEKRLLPLPFWFFHEFVANYYNWYESTTGWCNIILKETQFDEEKGFWDFYELFDIFKSLSIQNCSVATLSKESVEYLYTNEFAPKRAFAPNYINEPYYIDPIEIFLIELTYNAGYLCMVNTVSQHRLERNIYKDKCEVETFIEKCFGSFLNWKSVEINNIEFCKEFQY
jgi:hypothetical protein